MSLDVSKLRTAGAVRRTTEPPSPAWGPVDVSLIRVTVAVRNAPPKPAIASKVWNGAAWLPLAEGNPKVWDGAAWQPLAEANPKVWNGSEWVGL